MILYGTLSKNGDRDLNEDFVGMVEKDQSYCFVIADGLGGHEKGEVASKTVGKSILEDFSQTKDLNNEKMEALFENAQTCLLQKQKDASGKEMLTTANILCVSQHNCLSGHVGDTRTYFFQNGKLISRTLDHSVPQMLVAAGEITEDKIRNHPDRNRLLKVMGIQWRRPPYTLTQEMELKPGQSFLMCTDGFWELIMEKQMISTLKKSKDPTQWLQLMESIVLKNGKKKNMDNYSAIAVWVV